MPGFLYNTRKSISKFFCSCWRPTDSDAAVSITNGDEKKGVPLSANTSAASSASKATKKKIASTTDTEKTSTPDDHNAVTLRGAPVPSSSSANANNTNTNTASSQRFIRPAPKNLELHGARNYVIPGLPEIDATGSEPDLHAHTGGGTNKPALGTTSAPIAQLTPSAPTDSTPKPAVISLSEAGVANAAAAEERPQPAKQSATAAKHQPHDDISLVDTPKTVHVEFALPPEDTPDTVRPSVISHRRRSRAVLIGIHYTKHKNSNDWEKLDTPIGDVRRMHNLLLKHGYTEFRILVDEFIEGYTINTVELPTKKTILKAFQWLVHDAKPGDRLFVHYCGHGHQIPTESLGESDGHDEAILPLAVEGDDSFIIDNELHAILVQPLPPGCTLMAVFDCCHSGTLLDLPWNHTLNGTTPRKFSPLSIPTDPLPRSTSPERLSMKSPTVTQAPRSRQSSTNKSFLKNPLGLPFIVLPDANEVSTPPPSAPTESRAPQTLQVSKKRVDLQRTTLHNTVVNLQRRRSSMTVMRPSEMPKSTLGQRPYSEIFIQHSLSPVSSRKTTLDTVQENPKLLSSGQSVRSANMIMESPVSVNQELPMPAAQVIAIAACLDQENTFENAVGGLLTNTFIEFMGEPNYQNASLTDVINFLWDRFTVRTDEMHKDCKPCDGNCQEAGCGEELPLGHCVDHLCEIPLAAPVPLVTSLTVLKRDDPLLEGLF